MRSVEQRIARSIERRIEVADRIARKRAEHWGAKVIEDVQRMVIASRDGQECYLCGQWLTWREITIDHVVPLSRGGDHSYANCKIACAVCNSRKGDRLLSEIDLSGF
jgi:5-methylcytosine-specific restriction endonuclease McrA